MPDLAPRLPGWPAAMCDELAASYVGLGETTFRQVMGRDGVAPIRPTPGRKLWRRRDLDAWLDRQGGSVAASAGGPEYPTDPRALIHARTQTILAKRR